MRTHAALTILIALSSVLVSASGTARTATNAERAACETKVQSKIDKIDARMRAPYSMDEGERLRERRRQLEIERANCRTKD